MISKKLKSEARAINQQLTPVWRRKTGQARLLLLDTPLGDGLTLYDLVPAQTATDAGVETGFDDPPLTEILEALSPAERAVTLALATPGVTTWLKQPWPLVLRNRSVRARRSAGR
ncbi:hypothetical protein ACWERI_38710 [Streptomyces collinus]